MSAPFLMWYDDNPKLPVARKIEDAIGAYCHRFPSTAPTLVLVNEAEVTQVAGIQVRGVTTVHRNTVWVGLEHDPRSEQERLLEQVQRGAGPQEAKGGSVRQKGKARKK